MSVDPQASAVEVRNLAVARGGRELFRAMDWSLAHGGFLAVTGPSGVGKSSLVACLAGAIPSAEGECRIASSRPFSVGRVFQNLRLSPNLSALTNTLCGKLSHYGWWKTLFRFSPEDRERAFRILESLGLRDLVHRKVRHLSGGEQQRVAIARVLAQDAELILADEPTSNLDPALAGRVLSVFRERCDAGNSTVIAVIHDRTLVGRFADFELRIDPEVDGGWVFRAVEREEAV